HVLDLLLRTADPRRAALVVRRGCRIDVALRRGVSRRDLSRRHPRRAARTDGGCARARRSRAFHVGRSHSSAGAADDDSRVHRRRHADRQGIGACVGNRRRRARLSGEHRERAELPLFRTLHRGRDLLFRADLPVEPARAALRARSRTADAMSATTSEDQIQDIIRCEALTRRFGAFTALKAVDFRVRRGEVVCIVGPSGGGKSTLLRTINGLEAFDEGSIVVDGIKLPGNRGDVMRIRREVVMVFQSFNLFPHMTVRRNVALAPMRARGTSRDEANARAERLLHRVGIGDQIDKYPEQLSGGQQQRVAIARALAMEPRVMLFDEPTSALDAEMVSEVLQVIRELVGTGMTMVIVTHELGFAREAADRIVFMESGTIAVEAPPPQFFANTADSRLASFLSKVL